MLKLTDPINYLRSGWIRPEDLRRYESLGYHHFKLMERGAPSEVLWARVKAYSERHYDGNLLDLIQPYGYRAARGRGEPRALRFWDFRAFFRPREASPRGLLRWRSLARHLGMAYPGRSVSPVVLDNRSLDGFLDPIMAVSCAERDCTTCGHCAQAAAQALRVDAAYRETALALGHALADDLSSGRMWAVHPRRDAPKEKAL